MKAKAVSNLESYLGCPQTPKLCEDTGTGSRRSKSGEALHSAFLLSLCADIVWYCRHCCLYTYGFANSDAYVIARNSTMMFPADETVLDNDSSSLKRQPVTVALNMQKVIPYL